MAEVEMLFSARHLSDELGITLQMLSKYAQAYTKLTKRQIKKQGRDGRHFTSEQREVIKNARDMVRTQTGMTVDEAMKRALVFESAALEVESWGDTTGFDLDRLKQALNESVTLPLVAELQEVNAKLQLLLEAQGQPEAPERLQSHPASEVQAQSAEEAPGEAQRAAQASSGLLVRAAVHIEGWLQKMTKR
jgi:hypothetical protein